MSDLMGGAGITLWPLGYPTGRPTSLPTVWMNVGTEAAFGNFIECK